MVATPSRNRGLIALCFVLPACGIVALVLIFQCGCGQSDRKQVLVAVMTDNVALLQQLDSKGVDLNAQYPERFNWTPLIAAIYFENTNVIAYLVGRGVDVSKRDSSGETALMMAIAADDTNTARLLFEKAPRAIRDGEDWSRVRSSIQAPPRDTALQRQWLSLVEGFLSATNQAR